MAPLRIADAGGGGESLAKTERQVGPCLKQEDLVVSFGDGTDTPLSVNRHFNSCNWLFYTQRRLEI